MSKTIWLKAIDECIETRWKPAAESANGMLPYDAPTCQLCEASNRECEDCPLFMMGKGCFEHTSPYTAWGRSRSRDDAKVAAQNMLDTLYRARRLVESGEIDVGGE